MTYVFEYRHDSDSIRNLGYIADCKNLKQATRMTGAVSIELADLYQVIVGSVYVFSTTVFILYAE